MAGFLELVRYGNQTPGRPDELGGFASGRDRLYPDGRLFPAGPRGAAATSYERALREHATTADRF